MIQIIPAIDLIDGKCVRLTQGDYHQKTIYNEDPLSVAREFEQKGYTRLHLVDLDGAKAKHIVNYKVLEKIALHTQLVIDFGGGLKSSEDLTIAFEHGATMVTGGSIAVKNPEVFAAWIDLYGGNKIILGADVHNEKIAVNGWRETTQEDLFAFIARYVQRGITQVICTDITKDGMLQGVNIALYQKILRQFPHLHLIASGGVGQQSDIDGLQSAGIPAVIVGKAFYEGKIK